MSILNRFGSNGHLDDARLASIWTDASLTGDAPGDAHLQACAACRSRLAAFSAWLEQVRMDANAEADDAFPAERLAVQQAQIFRRIEAAERPARVIAFPKFARPISSGGSHARRWITGAAAGLIVGVALGQYMDLRRSFGDSRAAHQQARAAEPRPAAPQAGGQPASVTLTDDALMARLEELATTEIPDSLVALDSMTPRARDLVHTSR